jgi:hypothetical protein
MMQPDDPFPQVPLDADGAPTVLDGFKALLHGRRMPIPQSPVPDWVPGGDRRPSVEPETAPRSAGFRLRGAHLRFPAALALGLIAQMGLERRSEPLALWVLFYLGAAALMGWAIWAGDARWIVPGSSSAQGRALAVRPAFLAAALLLTALTFIASSDNLFRPTTVAFWVGAMVAGMIAFWEGDLRPRSWLAQAAAWLRAPRVHVHLGRWSLAIAGVVILTLFFRFAYLRTVPIEMVSDHAEKLLDVADVERGLTSIFFPRNTGREALQFYLAAATDALLGTGISFLTLKIGTALAGWVTLIFVYLFAREVAGRRTALIAFLLAGIAYWPNVISRVGLRFPLYPLFVAPAMFFLARGIRRRSRNDFLWCGLFVGLGLHGYSPTRVLPLVIAFGVLVFLLHREARGQRMAISSWLVAAGLVALIALTPLLRAAIEMPDQLFFRVLTRIGETERELPGRPIQIFLGNTWNALRMFGWDDGEVWVNSIPHRPALDWVSAALFHLGIVALVVRYVRRRSWLDLYTLLSIPLLLLPSIMALAFPAENPAPNRAAGAILPVYTLAAVPLAGMLDWIQRQWSTRWARAVWTSFALLLLLAAMLMNYQLVFVEYANQFRRSAWNTGQMGEVIRSFAASTGSYRTAHVVAFPYWVDTRLVGIHAGDPLRDYAIWPPDLATLANERQAQLFILNAQDQEGLAALRALFPEGALTHFVPPEEGHDFLIYSVPAREPGDLSRGPGAVP